jgi:hypothetical protein
MVWSVNAGRDYPFGESTMPNPTKESDPENLEILDTNKNGILDSEDDPYGYVDVYRGPDCSLRILILCYRQSLLPR